jgi:uncharacterized protein
MEVFVIPHSDQYIIYFPFLYTILLGNAALVNIVNKASDGEESALRRLHEIIGDEQKSPQFAARERQSLCIRRSLVPFKPTSVSLFLTENCTLRCGYCYAHGGKSEKEMPWDTVSGVINETFRNAISSGQDTVSINFHGGDIGAAWPLFVRTREYLRYKEKLHRIRVVTSVGTNGVLDLKQRSWLIQNIDSATISLDGPPDIHDFYRRFRDGRPSSCFVLDTLRHFDKTKFKYGIRTTITSRSVARMEEIVSYICENSAAVNIKIEPMFPYGRADGADLRTPDSSEFVDNFRKAREVALAYDRRLSYSGARLEVLTNAFCRACGDSCVVTPAGDITSCYEVADAKDPLADVFFFGRYDPRTRTLTVNEERRRRLNDLSVLDKEKCRNCFCKWHCAGDCPAKTLRAETTGNNNLSDRCFINRELTKDQLASALGIKCR